MLEANEIVYYMKSKIKNIDKESDNELCGSDINYFRDRPNLVLSIGYLLQLLLEIIAPSVYIYFLHMGAWWPQAFSSGNFFLSPGANCWAFG